MSTESKQLNHGYYLDKKTTLQILGKKLALKNLYLLMNILAIVSMGIIIVRTYMQPRYKSNVLCVKHKIPDNNDNLCSETSRIDVLILINSYVRNKDKRDTIRKTWGNSTHYVKYGLKVMVFFLLGEPSKSDENLTSTLKNESKANKDIINNGIKDIYNNNILKHIFGIEYVTTRCGHADLFIKTDDDIFLRVEKVYDLYRTPNSSRTHFYCTRIDLPPSRDQSDKWFISEKVYGKTYPPYCMGSFYAINMTSLITLRGVMECNSYFWIDDVHITGELREISKISILNMPRQYQCLIPWGDSSENIFNLIRRNPGKVLYHHYITPEMMRYLWSDMKK